MKLLRPEEVADIFEVSQATISRMCTNGDLPHIVLRSGRRKKVIRFRPDDVEKWLRLRTRTAQTPSRSQQKSSKNGNLLATEKERCAQAGEIQTEKTEVH